MNNFKKDLKIYLTGIVLGIFLATVAFYSQPIQWKGQALIKIGQFNKKNNIPIELLPTVIDRLKSHAFIKSAADRANNQGIKTLLNPYLDHELVIRQTKNGDSLELIFFGDTYELVNASINALVGELLLRHDALLQDFISEPSEEIERLNSEINVLAKRLHTSLEKPSQSGQTMSVLQILQTQAEFYKLKDQVSVIRQSISSINIRPTSLMESVFVAEHRLIRSLWRTCLAGALIGLIFSALLIRLKR